MYTLASITFLAISIGGVVLGTWWLWAPMVAWFSYLTYKSVQPVKENL